MIDLLRSSQAYHRSALPCHWTTYERLLRPSPSPSPPLDTDYALGRGFFTAVAAFPACYIRTAVGLVILNQVMNNLDPTLILSSLSRTLSTTQHSLLSLPSWDELSVADHEHAKRQAHETSRLATAIYSNAVLLGLFIS